MSGADVFVSPRAGGTNFAHRRKLTLDQIYPDQAENGVADNRREVKKLLQACKRVTSDRCGIRFDVLEELWQVQSVVGWPETPTEIGYRISSRARRCGGLAARCP
jgi:hypothetical protein